MEKQSQDFSQAVAKELTEFKGTRIHAFYFQDKKYWLKQPEQLEGIERFLKPSPKRSFYKELNNLRFLSEHNAPVASLLAYGDDYMVLEDAGRSASSYIESREQSDAFINEMLATCGATLADLHRQNLTHGRPALRDMVYKDGKVCFVDFENGKMGKNLMRQKVRDSLLYIHSLGRAEFLKPEQMALAIEHYHNVCDKEEWQAMLDFLDKYRPLYRFLCLFKKVARTDLQAIYRLFEHMDAFRARQNQ